MTRTPLILRLGQKYVFWLQEQPKLFKLVLVSSLGNQAIRNELVA